MVQEQVYYVMQDGRDFYCYKSNPINVVGADYVETHRSIIKVRDGDIDDAIAARNWFMKAICEPRNIQPIFV